MNYQACLHTATDTGSRWTTLASGATRQSCLRQLSIFLARQPLHHWGIRKESLIKLYCVGQASFIETLSIVPG
jgi:hypothetical protein